MKTILKSLKIDTLPPIYFADTYVKVYKEQTYHFADVYECLSGELLEYCTLHALSEEKLKDDLLKTFNIHIIKNRTFDNFRDWYKKLTKKNLTKTEIKNIVPKFKY